MTADSNHSDKPQRRFHSTVIKIIGAHIILILIAIVFIIIYENRQAENDWNEFRAYWEAKGEVFDLEKILPSEIPDDENFVAAPIIAEVFDAPFTNRLSKLERINQIDIDTYNYRPFPSRTENKQRWKNSILEFPDPPLSEFVEKITPASSEKKAAAIIISELEPISSTLNELKQASFRPKARYPVDYSNFNNDVDYSHLTSLRRAFDTLQLRTRARMALGDSAGATDDILTCLRIADLTGAEPMIISHMYEGRFYNKVLQNIKQGLASGVFDDELTVLGGALLPKKFKLRFLQAIRAERAAMLLNNQNKLEEFYENKHRSDEGLIISRGFNYVGLSNVFWFRNKLTYSRFIQEHFLLINGQVNQAWVDLDAAANTKADLLKLKPLPTFNSNAYAIFLYQAATNFGYTAQTTAQTATYIDLARIAIALELYRREHHLYPNTLASLAPKYIDAVPLDLITGKPLHYRIKADGTPLIYSVGLNKIDDGGQPRRKLTSGDWVWQYTLPDDFDEEDWRK